MDGPALFAAALAVLRRDPYGFVAPESAEGA
jgi:hypothetical protein